MSSYKIIFLTLLIIISLPADSKPIVTDSRVKTLVYNPNEVFELKANHNYQSCIELSKGEVIKSLAIGESSSWRIVPTGNKIFVRPLEDDARTNLMIVTNKFVYTFDLIAIKSIKAADMTYMMRFYYPGESDSFDKNNSIPLLKDEASTNKQGLSNKKRNTYTNYSFSGDKELLPLEIFDNGSLTFFKFGNQVPRVLIVKDDDSESCTEMISFEDLIMIDGVYNKLLLRHDGKQLTIIKGKS